MNNFLSTLKNLFDISEKAAFGVLCGITLMQFFIVLLLGSDGLYFYHPFSFNPFSNSVLGWIFAIAFLMIIVKFVIALSRKEDGLFEGSIAGVSLLSTWFSVIILHSLGTPVVEVFVVCLAILVIMLTRGKWSDIGLIGIVITIIWFSWLQYKEFHTFNIDFSATFQAILLWLSTIILFAALLGWLFTFNKTDKN